MNQHQLSLDERLHVENALAKLDAGGPLLSADRRAIVHAYRLLQQEILVREQQVATYQEHALVDSLTGLWNRRHLHQHLTRLGEHASDARYCEDSWMVVLDGDGVKRVNDHGGHAAGDQAICAIATYLTKMTRPSDLIFRLGGDEFVITYTKMPQAGLEKRLTYLVTELPPYLQREAAAHLHGLTLSIGAAPLRAGENPEDALQRADDAMYVAKKTRNTWHIA